MHGAAVFSSGIREAKDLFDSPMRDPGQEEGGGSQLEEEGAIRLANGPFEAGRERFPVHAEVLSIGRAPGERNL